jgi:hypothetical protein
MTRAASRVLVYLQARADRVTGRGSVRVPTLRQLDDCYAQHLVELDNAGEIFDRRYEGYGDERALNYRVRA